MLRTMMNKDPWAVLSRPTKDGDVVVRRVDEKSPWHFFWGLDQNGACLLMLRLSTKPTSLRRLPRLKGVDVVLSSPPIGPCLVIRLLDTDLKDIFYQLCTDILVTAEKAASELDLLELTINRTWRWHYLLKGGGSALLNAAEQLGLLGELHVIENHLLPVLSPESALESWRGPYGAAQDFVIGSVAIESKVFGPVPNDSVFINSEHQLDSTGLIHLFLYATRFMPSSEDVAESFTLTDVVTRVWQIVAANGFEYQERFNALLSAAGFRREDDYSPWRWRHRETTVYEVRESFPRLTPSTIPMEVSNTRYSLALNQCSQYLVPCDRLKEALLKASV
jgi:hypothetical protein